MNDLIVHVATTWTDDNNEDYLWQINGCAFCEGNLVEWASGVIVLVPLKPGASWSTITTFCSQSCADNFMTDWYREAAKAASS